MSIRSCWLMVLLSSIFLLIFCLVALSVVERRLLTCPNIIVDVSVFKISIQLVLATHILTLYCLVHTYLKLLSLLDGSILIALCNIFLCFW